MEKNPARTWPPLATPLPRYGPAAFYYVRASTHLVFSNRHLRTTEFTGDVTTSRFFFWCHAVRLLRNKQKTSKLLNHALLYAQLHLPIAISEFWKQILHVLVKRITGIMCAKNGKVTFKFAKVIRGRLYVFSSGHGVHVYWHVSPQTVYNLSLYITGS